MLPLLSSREKLLQAALHHFSSKDGLALAALAQYPPTHTASAASLALYFQAVLQGAFILAKRQHSATPVKEALAHLRQYLKLLFPKP
jgi:TetR/AcrR family transcriptional repressor of nem operon